MAAKWILAVVVVLCLAGSLAHPHRHHHHHHHDHELQRQTRDIIDDIIDKAMTKAKQAIHDVIEKTKKVIEDGEKGIELAVQGIAGGLHAATDAADAVLQGLGDKLVAKIEDVLKEAEAAGLNVTHCAEGKVTEAHQIETDAHNNIKQCIATAEKVGDDVKAAFENEVKTIEANMDKEEGQIMSCIPEHAHHSLEEAEKVAKCLAEQVVNIHEQNKETLASLAVQVTQANLKVKNAIEDGVKCINGEVQGALSKEKTILDEVNKCITESM